MVYGGAPGAGWRRVRVLIGTAGSPLRATVVQDSHRLAGCIVDVLEKVHRGDQVGRRRVLDAEIYGAVLG